MDEPQKRKLGRPRRIGPAPPKDGAIVSAWLPLSDYDRIYKIAKRHDVSISAVVRSWIRQSFK